MKSVHIDTMASGTATEVDVLIGGIIRDRRAALGLTQAELGKAIGVTFQQVQKYERGVNRVAAATLLKVADALQCSVADLYGDPDPDGRSPSERAILKLWVQLRDPERDAVIAMVREFAKRQA
ncbi:transcriptional regulator with XRE-family HTH domain [Brevundimonas vesicularis]|uniref:Transcriptional regulator with XRE-family HTH domain n=1 Tax=Brevundimonas vesicularis TaxID=41276 RepID=A0A7W9FWY5_BREVE|nr:helix-turn-helix domain-containing protein [Brevundimonas vesicularis]MBB5773107.1 transcriptional regulator with XRE-family HTH domain [Brevundimonas vesicularis]